MDEYKSSFFFLALSRVGSSSSTFNLQSSKALVLRAKNGVTVNVTTINPIKVAGFAPDLRRICAGFAPDFKVAGFESKERLRSSEMKEDGLRFVLRGKNESYLRHELIYKVLNSCFRENLVQIYF